MAVGTKVENRAWGQVHTPVAIALFSIIQRRETKEGETGRGGDGSCRAE